MPHAVIKSVLLFTNSYTCELAIQSINSGAQNKGWKLVGHSIKIGTLLWTIIGFPIGNVQ